MVWLSKHKQVRFTGENSTPFQEREAKKVLEVGQVYDVEKIENGNWFSFILLKGIKGKFAIEMFEGVESQ